MKRSHYPRRHDQQAPEEQAPSRIASAVGRVANITNRLNDRFEPTKEKWTRRGARLVEAHDVTGSSAELIHLSNALVGTIDSKGKPRGRSYQNYLGNVTPLAVRELGNNKFNAVLGLVLAGDTASAIVANQTLLPNGDTYTSKVGLVLTAYGYKRSSPGESDKPAQLLGVADMENLRANASPKAGKAFAIGTKVQGMQNTDHLDERHFDFLIEGNGHYGTRDNDSEYGHVVFDADCFNDGTLVPGTVEFDIAMGIAMDLQAHPNLWDMTIPEAPLDDQPAFPMPNFSRFRRAPAEELPPMPLIDPLLDNTRHEPSRHPVYHTPHSPQ